MPTEETRPYPLFPLIERRPGSAPEAEARLADLLAIADERVAGLLAYLDQVPAGTAEATLASASEAACAVLPDPRFSRPSPGPQAVLLRPGTVMVDAGPELTAAGRALAGDLGLILARALMEVAPGVVRWDVVTHPPRDASLFRPVLRGFRGGVPLDPYRVSLVCALKVIGGDAGAHAWLDMLGWWSQRIATDLP